jgi:hypothetical protein
MRCLKLSKKNHQNILSVNLRPRRRKKLFGRMAIAVIVYATLLIPLPCHVVVQKIAFVHVLNNGTLYLIVMDEIAALGSRPKARD